MMQSNPAQDFSYFWDWNNQWFVKRGGLELGPLPDEAACRRMIESLIARALPLVEERPEDRP